MSLLAIGINHNTASVDIREKVSFTPETMSESLQSVLGLPGIQESVILSTCNRSEIYCSAEDATTASDALIQWMASVHHLDPEALRHCTYVHTDKDAVEHISQVAAGLDSMVLGEPQILGQLKSAYAVAQEYNSVGSTLNFLFQHSFKVAKKVRTETAIGENAVSIAYAAVSLSTRIFSDLSKCHALLVGAGETIDLVARHLRERGLKHLTVANRTLARAEALANEFNARACLLSDIPDELPKADIVITSTASQLPLIGKGMVERALKQRRHKPVFMVDIAVPRDVESEVAELDDVFLYTVDDLRTVIEDNRRSREKAAVDARKIIEQQTDEFISSLSGRSATDAIREIRARAKLVQLAELEKAERALDAGNDPKKVAQQLAHNLTNKLMHGPTVALRRAHEQGEDDAATLAMRLFDIDP
ncbi:glutamyl-tRNA reductase [Reinekea blandensis]|uniref:Glutamyl-tRNA reductase n=1 Tax=Reinekea blandensis MED297 TaxID=314283 RepID=A4BI75_9GAMM|nr:glutamyl-tRNA reductase [Reinekea blandensis]EAR08218.1 glutamyl-tRNA reductase [Reinekea sp. MED297] [Reinekea blandensis MED297]